MGTLFLIIAAVIFCWFYFINEDEAFVAVALGVFISAGVITFIMAMLLIIGICIILF